MPRISLLTCVVLPGETMSPQMKKMLIIVGIILGIIFGIYFVKKAIFAYFISTYQPPAVTISASKASGKTWQSYLSSVGTLTAVNGTDISSEAAGMVKEIRFESGQNVAKGDILVVLDTSVEKAQLENDEAKLALAQINFNRYKTLLGKKVASQSEYDTSIAQLDEAKANVQGTMARIQQKTILAPFDGKIGIRQINLGQYVSAGNMMVTLQALDPLYVQFNIPEQFLAELYIGETISLTVNTSKLNSTKTFQGLVTAINSKIDPITRNILVEATIPNKSQQLYPGMFAQVKVMLRQEKNVIALPQTAISYSLHGDSVFIIKEDDKHKDKENKPYLHVYRKYVKVGERREDEVAVLDGINENDEVVTSGQLKLENGTRVVIDNSVEL